MPNRIVVVEGGSFGSLLSDYLSGFKNYTKVAYASTTPLLWHVNNCVLTLDGKATVLDKLHLTAWYNQRCTELGFITVDMALLDVDAVLILAVGKGESSEYLMPQFAESLLKKTIYHENQPVSRLLDWLGFATRIDANAIRQPTQT